MLHSHKLLFHVAPCASLCSEGTFVIHFTLHINSRFVQGIVLPWSYGLLMSLYATVGSLGLQKLFNLLPSLLEVSSPSRIYPAPDWGSESKVTSLSLLGLAHLNRTTDTQCLTTYAALVEYKELALPSDTLGHPVCVPSFFLLIPLLRVSLHSISNLHHDPHGDSWTPSPTEIPSQLSRHLQRTWSKHPKLHFECPRLCVGSFSK